MTKKRALIAAAVTALIIIGAVSAVLVGSKEEPTTPSDYGLLNVCSVKGLIIDNLVLQAAQDDDMKDQRLVVIGALQDASKSDEIPADVAAASGNIAEAMNRVKEGESPEAVLQDVEEDVATYRNFVERSCNTS